MLLSKASSYSCWINFNFMKCPKQLAIQTADEKVDLLIRLGFRCLGV
jgi:hypothetical protein